MTEETGLNERQQIFVANYIATLNATQSAIVAGYSPKTARSKGSQLLTNVNIKALVDLGIQQRVMSALEVVARLSDMARADLADVLNDDDEFDLTLARQKGKTHLVKKIKRRMLTDKDGNTTREIEIELHDAQAALEKLGRYHKLFTNVHEVSGKDGGPIVIAPFNYSTAVAAIAAGSEPDSASPGEGETSDLRETVGQDSDGG